MSPDAPDFRRDRSFLSVLPPQPQVPMAVTLAEFLAAAQPPEFLIDPLLQRAFLYTLTAPTFHGKTTTLIYLALCVAIRKAFAGLDTQQGRVAYFAGENPDDIAQKFTVACDFWGLDPATVPITIIPGAFDLSANLDAALARAAEGGPLALNVIDTSAAYRWDDYGEDDNQGSKEWAQGLRRFTGLPGKPAVVVPVHPTKNARKDLLIPRGGGAFLNEVDGNLTLWAELEAGTTQLHWQGKFRGPSFAPIDLELRKHAHPTWCHRDGKPVEMAVAVPSPKPQDPEAASKPARAVRLTDQETIALRTLDKSMKADAVLARVFENDTEGLAVREGDWRNWFYRETPDSTQDAKQKAFKRCMTALLAKGRVATLDGFVWPTQGRRI
jgi:hypothetical protein